MDTANERLTVFEPAAELRPALRACPLLSLGLGLSGCSGAPLLSVAGAYFPAWLACALLGLAGALLARAVLLKPERVGTLPWPFWLCVAVGVIVGLSAWLLWVGV